MIKKHSQTAILLFAQTAQVDATRKSQVDIAVMDVLNTRILKTVQSSGLDYYHFTEKEQRGDSFGSRIANSFQDIFNLGYESVICLGNDTPLLTVDLIKKASQSLKKGNAVKGKSFDGGLYLIGLNRYQFNNSSFENLPWQSKALATSFHSYIQGTDSTLIVLKSLQDINSSEDLHQFLSGKDARVVIVGLLLNTLSRKRNTHKHSAQKQIQVLILQPANKGSPVAIAA